MLCSNILSSLEGLGFESGEIAPTSLKKGFGPEVCQVVLFLLNKIFAEKKLSFKTPVFPQTKD